AVNRGQIPHLDLYVIREQIDKALAKQGIASLETLEESVSHARPTAGALAVFQPDLASSYLTAQEEDESLLRMDAAIGDPVA
nr:hypothetical protein [Tanacetum cinerariifolium]